MQMWHLKTCMQESELRISRSSGAALEWVGAVVWFGLWGIRDWVNSFRSVGECGGKIKTRQHCLSPDPAAALPCLGIALIHLQCRNLSTLLSSYAHGADAKRTQTFSFHLKITLWLFSLSCLPTPPLAYSLWNSFISQTSVGKRESLISQGLSFKFHYWNYTPIWVTADAAVLVWFFSPLFLL